MGAVSYHNDDADDEEDDDDDHDDHHHHQSIFKTLLIKVVPVYSREDIREQYFINDKELQVIPIFSYHHHQFTIIVVISFHYYHHHHHCCCNFLHHHHAHDLQNHHHHCCHNFLHQNHHPNQNSKVLDRRKKGLLGCFSDTQPSPCTRHGDLHHLDIMLTIKIFVMLMVMVIFIILIYHR